MCQQAWVQIWTALSWLLWNGVWVVSLQNMEEGLGGSPCTHKVISTVPAAARSLERVFLHPSASCRLGNLGTKARVVKVWERKLYSARGSRTLLDLAPNASGNLYLESYLAHWACPSQFSTNEPHVH